MSSNRKARVEGIYFNSSSSPVFLEGMAIGGHEYVYVEGFLRVPGHFIEVKDPQDNPDAPESFRVAYRKMVEKGEAEKLPTHEHSTTQRSNVIPVDGSADEAEEIEPETEPVPEEEPEEEKIESNTKPARSRGTRKGKGDSASKDEGAQ